MSGKQGRPRSETMAMASRNAIPGVKEQLANVAKLISEAQTLDGNGDELGAYRHYLSCVAQMAQTLSNDIQANQGQGTLPQQQSLQLFKMARNCLERGEEIYTAAKKEQRPLALFRLASPSPTASPTQLLPGPSPLIGNGAPPRVVGLPPVRAMSWPNNIAPPKKGVVNVRAVGVGRDDRVDGPSTIPERDGPSEPQPSGTVRHLSYMEKARLRNQHMMEQYKSYLRENSSHLPSDAGLSMLRRLEENVSVARIREQTIARKLRERQLRIQQEARSKRKISLSTLSVDELCDCVTSYEHGKSNILSIKTRLNTSGSDLEKIYGIVSEILNLTDHPLAKLLGEGQYKVYMMLQPVVLAIEKAGGLPRLEIRLDNCGLDRKPSEDILDTDPQSSGGQTFKSSSHTCEPQQDDDSDLLDLLAEDDDDDEMLALATGSQPAPTFDPKMSEKPGKDMLEQLKARLLEREETKKDKEVGESGHLYNVLDPSDEAGNDIGGVSGGVVGGMDRHPPINPRSVYESFNFDSNASYSCLEEPRYVDQHLLTRNRERLVPEPSTTADTSQSMYSNIPKADTSQPIYSNNSTNDEHPVSGFYDVPPSRPVQQSLGGDGDREVPISLYDQIRAVNMEDGEERDSVYEDLDKFDEQTNHVYEQMDSVFMPSGDQENNPESTDGAMFSQPVDQPLKDEMVVFNNLPTLVCAAHLGDEASLLKLSDTASSVIKEAIKNIQNVLNTLEEVFAKCYPVLNSEQNREVCSTVLETNLFSPILQPLTLVYRCKNYKEESITARNMCQHVNATPKDLSVRKKFWLIEQTYAPYGEAIDELRQLPSLQGPTPKLDGLVRMSKQIVKCIDDHYEAKGRAKGTMDTGVGVDDILPILSYIIIRSGLPQLVSECSIMEEFIRDGYMRGEEGFCLTSFLTALKFISHMSS